MIETPRTRIRPWRPEEADRFYDIYSRWEVARWLGARPRALEDPAEAAEGIARWATLDAENTTEGRWAVERREDGLVLGSVILVRLPGGDGEHEVGWHLHPDAWGHGYATEAAGAVLATAFSDGHREVFAVVRPDNTASLGVARRLGMEALGRTRRYYDAELELFRATAGLPGTGPANR